MAWLHALALSLLLVLTTVAYVIINGRRGRRPSLTTEAWTDADEKLPVPLRTACKLFLTSLMRFPDNVLTWRDMSEHNDPPMYDGVTTTAPLAVRDFTFSVPPSYDEDMHAFNVGGVTLTGPLSMNLGMYANDRFTLLWQARMDQAPPERVVVFETRANTVDNLGFRVVLTSEPRTDGASVQRVVVEHSLVETERAACSWVVPSLQGDHFVAVVHDPARRFRLYLDGAWVPESEDPTRYVNGVESALYSNRPCMVNPDGLWDARVTAVALYRTDLSEAAMDAVAAYVRDQRVKISTAYQELVQERELAEQKRKCPFDDPTVCSTECVNVTDWTDILAVGRDASVTCRKRILEHCSLNPGANSCTCLAPDDAANPQCSAIRAFFDSSLASASCPTPLTSGTAPGGDEPSLDRYAAFSIAATAAAAAASPSTFTAMSSSSLGRPVVQEVFT